MHYVQADNRPGVAQSSYVAIAPCRLIDTRTETTVGPRSTPLSGGTATSWSVWGHNGNCNIPSDATAVTMKRHHREPDRGRISQRLAVRPGSADCVQPELGCGTGGNTERCHGQPVGRRADLNFQQRRLGRHHRRRGGLLHCFAGHQHLADRVCGGSIRVHKRRMRAVRSADGSRDLLGCARCVPRPSLRALARVAATVRPGCRPPRVERAAASASRVGEFGRGRRSATDRSATDRFGSWRARCRAVDELQRRRATAGRFDRLQHVRLHQLPVRQFDPARVLRHPAQLGRDTFRPAELRLTTSISRVTMLPTAVLPISGALPKQQPQRGVQHDVDRVCGGLPPRLVPWSLCAVMGVLAVSHRLTFCAGRSMRDRLGSGEPLQSGS